MEFMKLWMACLLLTSIGIAHAQIPDYLQKAADQGEAKAELQVGIERELTPLAHAATPYFSSLNPIVLLLPSRHDLPLRLLPGGIFPCR